MQGDDVVVRKALGIGQLVLAVVNHHQPNRQPQSQQAQALGLTGTKQVSPEPVSDGGGETPGGCFGLRKGTRALAVIATTAEHGNGQGGSTDASHNFKG
jgi:hypothetical protein